jgi:glycosyltransferase involved in cell wall biosynthesis
MTAPKKILYIVADGSLGGGTTHCLQLLREFCSEFDLGLITQRQSYLEQQGFDLGISTFGLDFFSSRLDLRVPLRINHIVRAFKPDIVHVHGGRAAFFWSLSKPLVPTIYTIHGLHFAHKRGLLKWLGYWGERWAVRRAQSIIFVSYYDRTLAHKYALIHPNQTESVIYNGIPLKSLPVAVSVPQWDVGFVGRLESVKDPLLFVEIIRAAPELKAVMVGDGSLRPTVQRAVMAYGLGDRLTLLGDCPRHQTLKIIADLGVLVMTSRWEALGLVLLEAMAIGVPVVAPAVGGIPEVIHPEKTGLLVESRCPQAFVDGIRNLQQDLVLKQKCVRQGLVQVGRCFSETRMLEEIEKSYKKLMCC